MKIGMVIFGGLWLYIYCSMSSHSKGWAICMRSRSCIWSLPATLLCFKWIEDQYSHNSGAPIMGSFGFSQIYCLLWEDNWHCCGVLKLQSTSPCGSHIGVLMNKKGMVELIVLNIPSIINLLEAS
jgi:hypothetical protein